MVAAEPTLAKEKISKLPDFAFHGTSRPKLESIMREKTCVGGHFFLVLKEDRALNPRKFIEKFRESMKISLGHTGYYHKYELRQNEFVFSEFPAILLYQPTHPDYRLSIDETHPRKKDVFGCRLGIFPDLGRMITVCFDESDQKELNRKWREHHKNMSSSISIGVISSYFLQEKMVEIMVRKSISNLE